MPLWTPIPDGKKYFLTFGSRITCNIFFSDCKVYYNIMMKMTYLFYFLHNKMRKKFNEMISCVCTITTFIFKVGRLDLSIIICMII